MKVVCSIVVLWTCLITMWQSAGHVSAEGCLKHHNLTSAQVEAVAPSTPVAEVPVAVKCYSRCLIQDYFGDDGKIDLQKVGKRGSEEDLVILSQCKQQFDGVTNLDTCDYPYLILQCYFKGKQSGTIAS
ncbi:GD15603 [Drosophila simulans]|uniref:GD15603 n=2 Tax=Drosophila simulans TaxID=7240 RepID=B4R7A8_DROSI|nr:GD15603 [Drosophila simulans]